MSETMICRECNEVMKALTSQHLKMHGMTIRQYIEKYPTQEIIWPNTGNDRWSRLVGFVIMNDGSLLGAGDIYYRLGLKYDDVGFKSAKSLARALKTMGVKFIRPSASSPLIWKLEAHIAELFIEKRKKTYK